MVSLRTDVVRPNGPKKKRGGYLAHPLDTNITKHQPIWQKKVQLRLLERRPYYRTSTLAGPRRPQAPVRLRDKTIIRAGKHHHTDTATQGSARARRHTAQDHRACTEMGATMHLTGVLGVSSPPLAPSHCSCSGAKKPSCSLRPPRQQQRRRLRVARAVEVGAPSAGAPEPEQVEEPSIDFAFVSVSSSRSRPLVFFSF